MVTTWVLAKFAFCGGERATARRRLLPSLLAAGLLAAIPSAAQGASPLHVRPPRDLSGPAYQILAPGDYGGLPPMKTPSTRACSTTNSRHCRAASRRRPRKIFPVGEVRGDGPRRAHREPRAGARDRARQERHPAHLRPDAPGGHVRLRLGRRGGPRPDPRARPGPRLRGNARHPRNQPLRTAAHRALVHAQRADGRLRRRTEELAARKRARR